MSTVKTAQIDVTVEHPITVTGISRYHLMTEIIAATNKHGARPFGATVRTIPSNLRKKNAEGDVNPYWDEYKKGHLVLQSDISGMVIKDWDFLGSVHRRQEKEGEEKTYELGERAFSWERIPKTPFAWYVKMVDGEPVARAELYIILSKQHEKNARWMLHGQVLSETEQVLINKFMAKKDSEKKQKEYGIENAVKFRLYKFETIVQFRMDRTVWTVE